MRSALNLNVTAHNLARWVSRLGLGETLIATDTLRRRHIRTPGRITGSARKLTVHLSQRWPWSEQFTNALTRLRSVVLVS